MKPMREKTITKTHKNKKTMIKLILYSAISAMRKLAKNKPTPPNKNKINQLSNITFQ
jgi:hypothetical protein